MSRGAEKVGVIERDTRAPREGRGGENERHLHGAMRLRGYVRRTRISWGFT